MTRTGYSLNVIEASRGVQSVRDNYLNPKQSPMEKMENAVSNALMKKKRDITEYVTINSEFVNLYSSPYNLNRQAILVYSTYRAVSVKVKTKNPNEKGYYITCATMDNIGKLCGMGTGLVSKYKKDLESKGLIVNYKTVGVKTVYKVYEI